jgi:diaminohydroxyphosphoribosylaminopyrimidine deaminase/5-amino-6-(5-phosphoribosylamino)uracil reductase
MVGSVIVHNGKIIGEGYHQKCGEAHAEVNAIQSVKNPSLLSQSTLYVNLEPCAHFGKTPPCADLIIKHQIPRVIIANIDPFSKVKGKGIEKLKNAGIVVITDILKAEGEELNKRFFTFHKRYRPYIILKWAQTDDGFIDIERHPLRPQKPNWITNQEARMLVHKWRAEEAAIMVGTNTAFIDNPKLNVRDWTGAHPVRIVIDRNLRLPRNLHLFDGTIKTLVFTQREVEEQENENIEYITVEFDKFLPEHILGALYHKQIQSLIIEGGAKLLQSFIDTGLWDEARVFTGNVCFGSGVAAPVISSKITHNAAGENYRLTIYKNQAY